jgi:4-hydroxy-3-methylbut-2-en-1-yl diphosphate synthase IspG/GcpE
MGLPVSPLGTSDLRGNRFQGLSTAAFAFGWRDLLMSGITRTMRAALTQVIVSDLLVCFNCTVEFGSTV